MKRKKTPGYQLPEVVNPEGVHHICIAVPDDIGHIRAFLGQLDMLSYWWTWERDELKRGKEAALVWREIVGAVRDDLENEVGCGGTVGINDLRIVGCEIEVQRYPGGPWGPIPGELCPGPQGEQGEPGESGFDFIDPGDPIDPPSEGFRCAVADTVADLLIDKYLSMLDVVAIGGSILAVMGAIGPLLGPVGLIVGLVLILVPAINAIGVAALRTAAEDSDFRAELRCIIYCNLGTDAVIDADTVALWTNELRATAWVCAGTFADFIEAMRIQELRALVLMATGLTASDCGPCGCDVWLHDFDFSNGQQDWTPQVRGGPCAVWSTDRWTHVRVSEQEAVIIERAITMPAGSAVTRITVYGGLSNIDYFGVFRQGYSNWTSCTRTSSGLDPLEGFAALSWGDDTTLIGVEVDAHAGGYAYVNRVVVEGTGPDPFA